MRQHPQLAVRDMQRMMMMNSGSIPILSGQSHVLGLADSCTRDENGRLAPDGRLAYKWHFM